MTIFEQLSSASEWEAFYNYKLKNNKPGHLTFLRTFIDTAAYLPILEGMKAGKPFPLPRKSIISKQGSSKKRVVYTYPDAENTLLKFLSYLLIRRFDHLFADNLYSFRPSLGVRHAVRRLTHQPGVDELYTYKVDISNYFNSIDISLLLPLLAPLFPEEPDFYAWLSALLLNPYVLDRGQIVEEEKGVMAGSPVSVFLANLYLLELDHLFEDRGVIYARYSDDIILMAETEEELTRQKNDLLSFLASRHLTINPAKEQTTHPHERWTFLGISYLDGCVDISEVSLHKVKAKIRRKTRALKRWQDRKQLAPPAAARALIRIFRHKFLDNSVEHELTWARWFFPLINTDQSLREIDHYLQDSVRYLASGTRSHSRYNIRYEDLKDLGYFSLVHLYYQDPDCEEAPETKLQNQS